MSSLEESDVLQELAELPTFHHPVVAPDQSRVALYYDITGRNEVHVLDLETNTLEQWSDGEVPRNARWFVSWDADGERVLFHLDEDGNEQNDIWWLDEAGNAAPLVQFDGQCVIADVTNDGAYLLFGSSRDGQMNVFRYAFETEEIKKLTDHDRAVYATTASPNGELIAYSTNETDDYDNRDVYVANIDGSNQRNLDIGEVGAEAIPNGWSPDGDRLLITDNTDDLARAGIYDLETAEVTWLGDGAFEEGGVAFLPDGETVITSRSRDASAVPVAYDLETGEGREFELPDGVAMFNPMGPSNIAVADDEVILQFTAPTRRTELWRYDLSEDNYEPLIEAEYGPFDRAFFTDATYFTFTSDGVPTTRQAAVEHEPYKELDIGAIFFDGGQRPSPLLVNPHGGPRARDTLRFNLYTQVLTSLGFSVLQVNYRGSSGRGRSFVEELIGDWGGAEQGDVATAVEHVLDRYDWLDEDRVVVFGGSYGGYSAFWQLVQYPELYDAGVAWIGLTDLTDMFEHTMPHFRTELMQKYLGTPEENPELYAERSPASHIEHLAAPLLIVHGINDRRVPVSQARIFRDALSAAGFEEGPDGDFEYEELGKEGHASTDQAQKLRMFQTLEEFLNRRVDLS